MSDIYVYARGNEDYSTIGECGALDATSCMFEEVANGASELTLEHPIDALGKFAYLVPDAVLKAEVPVRSVPEIRSGRFVTSVESWRVRSTATKAQRYLYKRQQGGSKLRLLDAGAEVVVTSKPEGGERWKAVSGRYSGWIAPAALESRVEVTIPDSPTGLERAVSPWECRDQLFRIYKVTRADDGVTVSARHISYDLLYNLTTYESDGEVELQAALDGVLGSCLDAHDFTAHTDIHGARSGIHMRDCNPIEALLDPEEGLAARWSAQLVRDDSELFLLSRAGGNRGMTIEYGKNLTGVEMDEDLSSVATAIRPLGEAKDGSPLYLPENGGLVESPLAGSYPFRRIQTLKCDGCKVGTDGVTEALALERMREQARAALDGGADLPTVSARVTFAQLGGGARYDAYRELESVYLYDEIRVRHPGIGVELTTEVVRVSWDCVRGRMDSIELGSLQALTPSVAGWQIPGGLNGGKIAQGTIGASALGSDVISARHLQADSVNTRALQADCVTTDKLLAGSVTAEKLAAGAIDADVLRAFEAAIENLRAGSIDADQLTAKLAEIEVLIAGLVKFDQATIRHLVAEAMNLEFGVAGEVFIENLMVRHAQILSATVGELVVKASDGSYYQLDVDADGNVQATRVTVTEGEIAAGQTQGGRVILETSILAENLSTSNLLATYALVNRIDAASIDVSELFAREAFIALLRTARIVGDKSLELIVEDQEASVTGVDSEFYLSDSPSLLTGGEWSTDAPASVPEGKYVWQRTRSVTAGGRETCSAEICLTASTGRPGPAGVGIASITEHYGLSASSSAQPESWSTQVELMTPQQRYLWNYETVAYTDGSSVSSSPCVIGVYGSEGTEGRGIREIVNWYLASASPSGVTTRTSGWTTSVQYTDDSKRYLWNYEEIHFSDSTISATTPRIIGTQGRQGAQGAAGSPGAPGADGRGILRIEEQWYLSTSPSSCTGGAWQSSQPAWEPNHYLWTRTTIYYDDGDSEQITTLADGINSANQDAYSASQAAGSLSGQMGDFVTKANLKTYLRMVSPSEATSSRPAGVYVGITEDGSSAQTEAVINAEGAFEVRVFGSVASSLGNRVQRLGTLTIYETSDQGHAFI